jgi:hypothetical protein
MKFDCLIKQKYEQLFEQAPGQDFSMPAPEAPAPAPVPAQNPDTTSVPQEQKPLTPEGEVFLIKLIKKALFLNPDDLELKTLKDLPEVDEKNASDVLSKIIKLMQVDAIDLDVSASNTKA